jgi:hypothetical protein
MKKAPFGALLFTCDADACVVVTQGSICWMTMVACAIGAERHSTVTAMVENILRMTNLSHYGLHSHIPQPGPLFHRSRIFDFA